MPRRKSNSNAPGSNQFKQDKEAQRKAAEAGGNTQAWNSLFMRPDTVHVYNQLLLSMLKLNLWLISPRNKGLSLF